MPLKLKAPFEVRALLRDLRDNADCAADFQALSERITALRHDPGSPGLRGKAYRVQGDETVRVSLVHVSEPAPHTWLIAWSVSPAELPEEGVPVDDDEMRLSIISIEREE